MSGQAAPLSEGGAAVASKRAQLVVNGENVRLQEALATKVIAAQLALKRADLGVHHAHVAVAIAAALEARVALRARVRAASLSGRARRGRAHRLRRR